MCDIIESQNCPVQVLLNRQKEEMEFVKKDAAVFVSAVAPLHILNTDEFIQKGDELADSLNDNGVSLAATVGTGKSSLSSLSSSTSSTPHEIQNISGKKTEIMILTQPQIHTDNKRQEMWGKDDNNNKREKSEHMFTTWPLYTSSAVFTAADIPQTLFTAFLLYTDEMITEMQSKNLVLQEKKSMDQNILSLSGAFDFIRLRLFPSGGSPSPHLMTSQQQQHQRKSSLTLSWFVQRYRELASTMMSMGFGFLFGLEDQQYSWKQVVEVPLMALQLLASYAYTLTFHMNNHNNNNNNNFDLLSPREHLLLMSACLLISWKYTYLDANPRSLIFILEKYFFCHQRILNITELIQLESAVLGVCGFTLEVPRWWSVAMELLTLAHTEASEEEEIEINEKEINKNKIIIIIKEEEEEMQDWRLGVPTPDAGSRPRRCTARLGQLLLASERAMMFLMQATSINNNNNNIDNEEEIEIINKNGGSRERELRGVLRHWLEFHPLFGAALLIASGAVRFEWVAAQIGPTALTQNNNNNNNNNKFSKNNCFVPSYDFSTAIREADAAAQREMRGMVAILTEILQLSINEIHS